MACNSSRVCGGIRWRHLGCVGSASSIFIYLGCSSLEAVAEAVCRCLHMPGLYVCCLLATPSCSNSRCSSCCKARSLHDQSCHGVVCRVNRDHPCKPVPDTSNTVAWTPSLTVEVHDECPAAKVPQQRGCLCGADPLAAALHCRPKHGSTPWVKPCLPGHLQPGLQGRCSSSSTHRQHVKQGVRNTGSKGCRQAAFL